MNEPMTSAPHWPDAATLRERLRHVYWIGGGSGAGKSTVAARLADRHGLRLYSTDATMADHARRTTPEHAPHLHEFIAMDMDERWVHRSPETMLGTFHWFRGEGSHLIVEDLLALPEGTGVVAEGFRLLPSLVRPLLADPARAVWLLPTPRFREAAIRSRASPDDGFLQRTSDPERAARNLAERERMFTEHLRRVTRDLGLSVVDVDGTATEDESVERVSAMFGL
ncbi:hypothetical protein LO763_07835 [Glycomyces sp. A-F 0318]|nr:hypothetical protein [Glycomyces amatae]MCD0443537.1 hypothetical protein [Glycomyces amatae]